FRMPFADDARPEDCTVTVPATGVWELEDNLPTGRVMPLDARRDLNRPRPFADVSVDDVLTGLPGPGPDGMLRLATLEGAPGVKLEVLASDGFRENVVYTPPHRKAFCVEPYTCVTDAVNLQQRGVDAGWRVLDPGDSWRGAVEMRLT